MGCEISCFGKTFSTKSKKRNRPAPAVVHNNNGLIWSGKMDYDGDKQGYGIERDTNTGIDGYGGYSNNVRVGIWEFKEKGVLKSVHEYNSGVLQKISEFQDGVPKEIYVSENLQKQREEAKREEAKRAKEEAKRAEEEAKRAAAKAKRAKKNSENSDNSGKDKAKEESDDEKKKVPGDEKNDPEDKGEPDVGDKKVGPPAPSGGNIADK